MPDAFLALDWGTTNLRAWVVNEAGGVARRRDFDLGVGSLEPGAAERRFHQVVRPAMAADDLPALLCGMIGSTLGWTAVPYRECPAGLDGLQHALHRIDAPGAPVWIVPGIRCIRQDGAPDVMRGEETQVLGWTMGDPARRRGEWLVCLPGTHAKWVRVIDGRIDTFVTSMTGELFALLSRRSSLRVADAVPDEAAFALGVQAAGDGGALAARLFTARSRVVGGDMAPRSAESYLSGLLIGADVAAAPALLGVAAGVPVSIVGDPALCAHYRQAIARHGGESRIFDGGEAVLAGLAALSQEVLAQC